MPSLSLSHVRVHVCICRDADVVLGVCRLYAADYARFAFPLPAPCAPAPAPSSSPAAFPDDDGGRAAGGPYPGTWPPGEEQVGSISVALFLHLSLYIHMLS